MKYHCEVVAYECGCEMNVGSFEVEAGDEDSAIVLAKRTAKKRFPNLEDFDVMNVEVLKNG